MGRKGNRLTEQRLIPFEAPRDVAYPYDGPRALHRSRLRSDSCREKDSVTAFERAADAEIRTGDDQFSPLKLSPLSSKQKFAAWDSQRKPMQILVPCDAGASLTAIDAMYRSGCFVHGASKWTRLLAKRRPAKSGQRGGRAKRI